MQLFSNYNFAAITQSDMAIDELTAHINILIQYINNCTDQLSDEDFKILAINIEWLKRFYEAAERCILNDN